MNKKIFLPLIFISISSCHNTQINNKTNNLPSSTTIQEKVNDLKNDTFKIDNFIFLGSKEGQIEINYTNQKILITYETEKPYSIINKNDINKSRITEIYYSDSVKENTPLTKIYPYFPNFIQSPDDSNKAQKDEIDKNSEKNKKKISEILSELSKLKGNSEQNELIKIAINLIEEKEINLFIETIDLNPNQSKDFVEFTKLSDNDFKLGFKNNDMFISLKNFTTKTKFYIKEGVFTINEYGLIIHKESGYLLDPEIIIQKFEKISKINNLGEVHVNNFANINSPFDYLISQVFANKFKSPEKLKLEGGFYSENENSGKSERINLKEISFKDRLRIKTE